jgi:hypothetical protein
MPAFLTCTRCSGLVRVPENVPGTRFRCPLCQAVFDADPNSLVELDFDPNAPDLGFPQSRTTVVETERNRGAFSAMPAARREAPRATQAAARAATARPAPPPAVAPRPSRLPLLLGGALAAFGVLALLTALLVWWIVRGPFAPHMAAAPAVQNQAPPAAQNQAAPVAPEVKPKAPAPEAPAPAAQNQAPPDLGAKEKGPGKKDDVPDARWTVLFRADDPTAWDTDSRGARFAVPLSKAPATIRYLRLRRMDTREALIVQVDRSQLRTAPKRAPDRGAWWNGTAKYDWGGRHLGIAEAPRHKFPNFQDYIAVMNEGWDVFVGSGFGHKCFRNEQAGQCYSWRGKEIPRTVFEIAVTNEPLSPQEQACLLPSP